MKGSSVPHLPRRHFRSYGHLPMPFGSLNQDSCSPLCPGSTPCAAPPGAGAVMAQGPQASPPGLRRHSSGKGTLPWDGIPSDACAPHHFRANHWNDSHLSGLHLHLTDFYYVAIYIFQNYCIKSMVIIRKHSCSHQNTMCLKNLLIILENKEVKQYAKIFCQSILNSLHVPF